MMFVHRAFSFPSEKLYLSTHSFKSNGSATSPSLPFNRIAKLFGITPHEYDGKDFYYLAGSPKSAISHIKELDGDENKFALGLALIDIDAFPTEDLSFSGYDSSIKADKVSEKYMLKLHNDTLYTTPSRLETFSKCPLRYFLNYELKLKDTNKIEFGQNNIGTFIHFILEKLIPEVASKENSDRSPEELFKLSENIFDSYVSSVTPEEEINDLRPGHLMKRLKYLSYLIVDNVAEELRNGEFVPAFFELPTNGKGDAPKPLELVTDTNKKVVVSGIIDRVDLIKKNDETYIRVIDYKTGNKDISVDDVFNGKNLQMLLYLFTLCDESNADFHKKIGVEDGKLPIPSGVMYLNSNIPFVDIEGLPSNEDDLLSVVKDGLKRTGLLLNEPSVLSAMNSKFDPKFLAGIRQKDDGELSGKALVSKYDFELFRNVILDDVRTKAEFILSGMCISRPLIKNDDSSACDYCSYRPICRKKNN
jgi:ATP-dependent helicase/nuclease subunit B